MLCSNAAMNSIAQIPQTLRLTTDQKLYLSTWEDEDLGRQHLYFLAESEQDARNKMVLLVPSNTLKVCGPMSGARGV